MHKTLPKYVENFILGAIFLSLPMSVMSGFSLTPINIILVIPFVIFAFRSKIKPSISKPVVLSVFILLCWAAVSASWAIEPSASLKYTLKVGLIFISGVILLGYIKKFNESKIIDYLPIASLLGLAFFSFEIFSEGFFTSLLRTSLGNESATVNLDIFNKAVSFLAIFIWPVITTVLIFNRNFSNKPKIFAGIILWSFAALIIFNLQSLSAILGFSVATVVFLFIIFTKAKFNFLISAGILITFLLVPFSVKLLDADSIITNYPKIPNSAAHRLHIWSFSADKASEKALEGWGMRNSRYIPGGQDRVSLDQRYYDRELIPSHPHNNSLQIWLELGLVGLALTAMILFFAFKEINKIKNVTSNAAMHAILVAYLTIGALAFDVWRVWWLSALVIAWFVMYLVYDTFEAASEEDS